MSTNLDDTEKEVNKIVPELRAIESFIGKPRLWHHPPIALRNQSGKNFRMFADNTENNVGDNSCNAVFAAVRRTGEGMTFDVEATRYTTPAKSSLSITLVRPCRWPTAGAPTFSWRRWVPRAIPGGAALAMTH